MHAQGRHHPVTVSGHGQETKPISLTVLSRFTDQLYWAKITMDKEKLKQVNGGKLDLSNITF